MTLALYGGIHHVMDDVAGLAITLGTEAAIERGHWVLGGERPATHAFVIVVDCGAGQDPSPDALGWRLDAKPSLAEWSPCPVPGYVKPAVPTAIWRILAEPAAIERGVTRARTITHASYDWSEIAGAAAVAFSILPLMSRLRLLGTLDLSKRAMICTQALRQTLLAVFPDEWSFPDPNPVTQFSGYGLKKMPDLFPERLGQLMQAGQGFWTTRVV